MKIGLDLLTTHHNGRGLWALITNIDRMGINSLHFVPPAKMKVDLDLVRKDSF